MRNRSNLDWDIQTVLWPCTNTEQVLVAIPTCGCLLTTSQWSFRARTSTEFLKEGELKAIGVF